MERTIQILNDMKQAQVIEDYAIVVQMQRIANDIRCKTGRKTLPEWRIVS